MPAMVPPQGSHERVGRQAGANGGVWAAFGEGVNGDYGPAAKYDLIFGPDGNLVNYDKFDVPTQPDGLQ
jgi:hypothetical protein